MAARIGGKLFISSNGVRLAAKGEWTVNPGVDKRDAVVGADQVHGYMEKPQVPSFEGAVTVMPDLDVKALLNTKDATITLELANGKTPVLREAWYAGEGTFKTDEGELAVLFQGLSMEID